MARTAKMYAWTKPVRRPKACMMTGKNNGVRLIRIDAMIVPLE